MADTKIEWAEKTWNPVTGCSKISPGCTNCYAERMARRLQAMGQARYKDGFKVTCHPDALDEPLRWKKPSRIFVCSMADLFHEDVPDQFLIDVFDRIAMLKGHTFLVLTKRPERMLNFMRLLNNVIADEHAVAWADKPLSNVWLGVTAENQEQADKRIPILLQIPAVRRFVSVEPMLGPVDLTRVDEGFLTLNSLNGQYLGPTLYEGETGFCKSSTKLDWVICGGESGPGARPMHPDWVRGLRDQCQAAGVPFLFKQWGEWQDGSENQRSVYNGIVLNNGSVVHPGDPTPPGVTSEEWNSAKPTMMAKVGKKKAGRLLDGRMWDEYPI